VQPNRTVQHVETAHKAARSCQSSLLLYRIPVNIIINSYKQLTDPL